ncbi:uncharacterized protein LOC124888863 [Capsicum annuum]|uniref:uncharacterized protein LOC124888863 n=1 Tax=Capsicum annuum TaxID=4072 RepID=UPI001FB15A6B|nr:uncharacterized protein LOC124888863 [Capsicum annuum]
MTQKISKKLKDQGKFASPIQIWNKAVHALSDLGASISLMPLSLFKTSGLGKPRLTTVVLQLADGSIKYPERVIEDILIKVGKFIIPADIFVFDFKADEQVLIILSSYHNTEILLDSAVGGQALESTYDKLYILLNRIVQRNPDWLLDSKSDTKRIEGVLKVDQFTALSAHVSILQNLINTLFSSIKLEAAQPIDTVNAIQQATGWYELDEQVPIILRHPFLATRRALIDVR